MKERKKREQVEHLLLILPVTLEKSDELNGLEKAIGWAVFEGLLREYVDHKHGRRNRRRCHHG